MRRSRCDPVRSRIPERRRSARRPDEPPPPPSSGGHRQAKPPRRPLHSRRSAAAGASLGRRFGGWPCGPLILSQLPLWPTSTASLVGLATPQAWRHSRLRRSAEPSLTRCWRTACPRATRGRTAATGRPGRSRAGGRRAAAGAGARRCSCRASPTKPMVGHRGQRLGPARSHPGRRRRPATARHPCAPTVGTTSTRPAACSTSLASRNRIVRRQTEHGSGLGRLRRVVERTVL